MFRSLLLIVLIAAAACLSNNGLAAVATAAVVSEMSYVPSVFWANYELFNGKEVYHVQHVGEEVLGEFVLKGNMKVTSDILSSQQEQLTPSKTVGFIMNHLEQKDIVSSKVIRSLLTNSISSAVFPFTAVGESSKFVAAVDTAHVVESADVQVLSEELKRMTSKNVMIVKLPKETSMAQLDDLILELSAFVPENSMMFVSGNGHPKTMQKKTGDSTASSSPVEIDAEYPHRVLVGEESERAVFKPNPIRNFSELFAGMITFVIAVLTLVCIIGFMDDIQSGTSFATKYPPKGKEFN